MQGDVRLVRQTRQANAKMHLNNVRTAEIVNDFIGLASDLDLGIYSDSCGLRKPKQIFDL